MFAKFLSHLRQQSLGALALFIVLGGSSYAVATGSIDGREIKNNAVGSKDLRNDDIRGKDIRTGTLGGSDVKNDVLTGADILESSLGAVPSAATASRAGSAGSASTAATASRANTADDAAALNGRPPATFEESAISGFRDGPVFLANAFRTVGTLPLPPGKYAINAKLFARTTSEKNHEVLCELRAGADTDATQAQVPASGTADVDESAPIALQLVTEVTGSSSATVRCLYGGTAIEGAVNARFVKITAISLDNLQRVSLGG